MYSVSAQSSGEMSHAVAVGSLPALAIHTTSPELGLALSHDGKIRSQTWDLGRSLSTHLHIALPEFLAPQEWSDLAFIAVAQGPGGFTGTRIGVVTARTLAQQLNIPLFGISTLKAIAWSAAFDYPGCDIAVQMPAQRGDVFTVIYQQVETTVETTTDRASQQVQPSIRLVPLHIETVLESRYWQHRLNTWERPYHLVTATGSLGASVTSLLELAWIDWQEGDRPNWSDVLPYYGQSPV